MKTKIAGAYLPVINVFHKKGGVYGGVKGFYTKSGGAYKEAVGRDLIGALNGADFTPAGNLSNCWQDTIGTIAGVEDAVCSLLESDFRSGGENFIEDSEFVSGTASSWANGWTGSSAGGITTEVVGKGTNPDGTTYQDIHIYGTNSSGSTVFPQIYPMTAGRSKVTQLGMLWSAKVKVALIAGSFTNIGSMNFRMRFLDASKAQTEEATFDDIRGIGSSYTEVVGSAIPMLATTEFTSVRFIASVGNTKTVDVTIRVCCAQLNRGRQQAYTPTYGTPISNGSYHCLSQATAGYTPFLRKNLSILPVTNPNLTLGPELITNGAFDSDTYWTKGTGWTISGGRASRDSQASATELKTGAILTEGSTYKLTFTLVAISGASLSVQSGGPGATQVGYPSTSTPGVYSLYVTAKTLSTVNAIRFIAVSDCVVSIDNVSLREVISGSSETWSISRTQVSDCAGIRWDENGTPYFKAVGVANNGISTPHTVANSVYDDFSVTAKIYVAEGSPNFTILDKALSGNAAWSLRVTSSSNKLAFVLSSDGSTYTVYSSTVGISTNTIVYIKAKRTASTGDIIFETSADGITYTQLGDVVAGMTGTLYPSTQQVRLLVGFTGILGVGRVYKASLYANNTATGVPVAEFNPSGVVRPTSYWLDSDGGLSQHYITTVQPGLYSSGYVCGAFNQYEAISSTNILFGSAGPTTIFGYRLSINAAGKVEAGRTDGSTASYINSPDSITQYVPFVASSEFQVSRVTPAVNGVETVDGTTKDFRGGSQVALMFTGNTVASGITPSGSYITGSSSGLCWLPTIPTYEQQAILRSYYASL